MKKWLAAGLAVLTLVACAPKKVEKADVKVVALKGPTSMGLVQFMNEVDQNKVDSNQYHFQIASAVDEVTPLIAKGEVDIATIPANLSSVIYKNTNQFIQVLGINTLGVLYLVETGDQIHQLSDLKGKTIYASGKGATPEYSLTHILEKNGITDAKIEWKSEHTEVVQALAQDPTGIALLPEPFVTVASMKNPKIHTVVDLNEEWKKAEGSPLMTGVVVARKEFIKKHPKAVEDFLSRYQASVEFSNQKIEEAAKLVDHYGIVKEAVAKVALPKSHIVLVRGKELKVQLGRYLGILYQLNPKAVGGALPQDDFYYGAQ